MKTPNPNLWSVTYAVDGLDVETLWICAATAETASSKARRVIKQKGYRAATITTIKHEGHVDAF